MRLAAAASLAVGAAIWSPFPISDHGRELITIHQTPAPLLSRVNVGPSRSVDRWAGWKAEHLFAFLWSSQWVDCREPAPFVFDGTHLSRVAPP